MTLFLSLISFAWKKKQELFARRSETTEYRRQHHLAIE